MESLIEFFSFTDPNVRYVVLGSVLLAATSAIVGTFTFLKKRALIGDAVAHAVLPGVCLAFLLSGSKNPFLLISGAFITGWISIVVLDLIVRNSKIKEDTAIGLVLSVFFGIGILLLTVIQHKNLGDQGGLDHIIFGKAAALVGNDLIIFSSISIILLFFIIVFYKELKLISFDPAFAQVIGFPLRALELLVTTLTVMAVVIGIQAVGVVLMAAMLITPAAAARFWTNKLSTMLILAALFGAFSGITGAFVSYTIPAMATGPWVVMVISLIAIFSFFLAPGKGIIFKMIQQKRNKKHIQQENILKAFFQLGEDEDDFFKGRTIKELLKKRNFASETINFQLISLVRQGYLIKSGENYSFTKAGKNKGQRVVKLHRLWELYLTKYLKIAPDHVHEDAENIEHIITPEIEKQLEEKLNFPEFDPHKSKIPYRK
jgi:manganese/zinc/iron transport system permease protein